MEINKQDIEALGYVCGEIKKCFEIGWNKSLENKSLEEEKELHGNNIEFNIYGDKRDCVITLDENDLGIDKLHLDNCYFYKKDNKWYVKKINFQTIDIKKDKKIEKIPNNCEYDDTLTYEEVRKHIIHNFNVLGNKINEIIDKVNSLENKQ